MEGASSSSSVLRDRFLVQFLWARMQRVVALRGHGAGLCHNSTALGTFRAGHVGVSPTMAMVHRHFISVSTAFKETKHFSLSPLFFGLKKEPRFAPAAQDGRSINPNF